MYDFGGFPRRFYEVTYRSPGAPDLARQVAALMPDDEPVHHQPDRGLDHGAYVPLTVMYPTRTSRCCRCRCPPSIRCAYWN